MQHPHLIHVLLVDDEDSFRLSLEMALNMTNEFIVEGCESGERALEELQKSKYDVILLDNKLGDMTGLDILEWLHKNKISTPVIMITAAGSEAIAVEAMKLGVYDYIRKDQLDKNHLSIAIKSVYERYLYRKQNLEREAYEKILNERQGELRSLQIFHETVNTVGQLVEKNISDFTATLQRLQEEIAAVVQQGNEDKIVLLFSELKERLTMVASGISSMRNLSQLASRSEEKK